MLFLLLKNGKTFFFFSVNASLFLHVNNSITLITLFQCLLSTTEDEKKKCLKYTIILFFDSFISWKVCIVWVFLFFFVHMITNELLLSADYIRQWKKMTIERYCMHMMYECAVFEVSFSFPPVLSIFHSHTVLEFFFKAAVESHLFKSASVRDGFRKIKVTRFNFFSRYFV